MQTFVNLPTTFLASFGEGYAGQPVGYSLKDPQGATTPAPASPRTTLGVTDLGQGWYRVQLTFSQVWAGYIEWDTGGVSPIFVREDIVVAGEILDVAPAPITSIAIASTARNSQIPQEVLDLRASSMEFHKTLGQMVIHKHKWNEQDVRNGMAMFCPFHSDTYERGQYDDYCFGTGYLGGFANGTLVNVTLGDSQEDVFRPNAQGVLIHERHPGLTAPWWPEMGDGDIIIVAEFDPHTLKILEQGDRYELREVTPVTMRGPGYKNTQRMKPFKVNQEAMIDLLPYSHPFYNVPVNFDYSSIPVPIPPDYPVIPDGSSFSLFEIGARIVGDTRQGLLSSSEFEVRMGNYLTSSEEFTVKITGESGGTHINW